MKQNKQTIVVADDDIAILKLYSKILKKFDNCDIMYFRDVNDAFYHTIDSTSIDLFIMDVRLANSMSGIAVTDRIIEQKQGSIFLFVSGHVQDEDEFTKLNGRCVYDYIKKPFDKQNLVVTISTLLNIANSYKFYFHKSGLAVPQTKKRIETLDDLRNDYFKMLDEHKTLIKRAQKLIK